jgi:hypothetical protein
MSAVQHSTSCGPCRCGGCNTALTLAELETVHLFGLALGTDGEVPITSDSASPTNRGVLKKLIKKVREFLKKDNEPSQSHQESTDAATSSQQTEQEGLDQEDPNLPAGGGDGGDDVNYGCRAEYQEFSTLEAAYQWAEANCPTYSTPDFATPFSVSFTPLANGCYLARCVNFFLWGTDGNTAWWGPDIEFDE